MVRSPKNARPSRVSAPISFAHAESDDDDDEYDIFNPKPQVAAKKRQQRSESELIQYDSDSDGPGDVEKFLKEMQKKHAKKSSARSAAFDNQKKALYASGRKRAQEVSDIGTSYLTDLKSNIVALREQEFGHDRDDLFKFLDEAEAASDVIIQSVLDEYPPVIEGLFQLRAQTVETASAMLAGHETLRRHNLGEFLRNAHDQVERSRAQERIATDATNLIRHYKGLLLGS